MIIFDASQFQGFTLDLSDREIYNDIRSETDITEQTEVIGDGTPEEYQEVEVRQDGSINAIIAAYGTVDVAFTAKTGHTDITWLSVHMSNTTRTLQYGLSESECTAQNGEWYAPYLSYPSACYFPDISAKISIKFITRGKTTATARITNPFNYEIRGQAKAIYQYLAQEAIEGARTIQTERRTLTVRAVNEDSIRKYGRRVMDLQWPLGQDIIRMQSLVDGYCARYCEPVSMASITIEGKNDDIIEKILNLKIDDKHEFVHPGLDMDEQFFINNLDVHHDINGLLEGVFDLEQVRDMERTTFFIINSSLIGGDDVIAP